MSSYFSTVSASCVHTRVIFSLRVQGRAPVRATVTRIMEAAHRSVRWSEGWSSAPVTPDTVWRRTAKPALVMWCVCGGGGAHRLQGDRVFCRTWECKGVRIDDICRVWQLAKCYVFVFGDFLRVTLIQNYSAWVVMPLLPASYEIFIYILKRILGKFRSTADK